MKKLFIGALAGSLLIVGISTALPPETRTQPADASETTAFDHSNCQYPDRWSNPADGCDNSDPAVPECIKAMSSQEAEAWCIKQFVDNKLEQPIEPTNLTPIEPAKPIECGGK